MESLAVVAVHGYEKKQSKHTTEDNHLLSHIKSLFEKSRGAYGSPRIHQALIQLDIRVSAKRVAWLMREQGLRARSVKIYRRVPGRHEYFTNIPNRLRKSTSHLPNNIFWVGDIAYVRSGGRWRFLAVVMDKCTRKIVGWGLSDKRDLWLTLKALNNAVRNCKPAPGLIFHSGRGNEYGAHKFRNRLKQLGIIQSKNGPRRMTDNAFMESFFHSFKSDCYHKNKISTDSQLKNLIKNYLSFL